ncbi:MAG: tungsten ABC transporter substrate-binding protein [Nitrosomonadales bacterium]|nr:MAG: tungsten ABC transporter substrate-binding protein [Nitrosomonadales bacterium]
MKRLIQHWLAILLATALALPTQAADKNTLRLATTTSTSNTGLLDYLLPKFEQKCGCKVNVISVGTGKALKLGEDGNVDVVLVHARPSEDAFVAAGHGIDRRDVMYNDFVLVGPNNDPARIKGEKDVLAAMKKIADTRWRFVSRGDDSGTDQMEKGYWKALGIKPEGKWYSSAGQGMGEVLMMAGEMRAYTLTDRGTYITYRDKIGLPILVEGDAKMFNPYGIIAVSPKKYPDINYQGAIQLIGWITSPEGQRLIGEFKVGGEQLFTPSAK